MDWRNLREKTGEIAGRIIAIERQFSEFRIEVSQRFSELREEMNQRFSEVNRRFGGMNREQDRLLYLMLALGMVENLAYLSLTS